MLQDTNSSYSIGLPNNCYHFDVCVLNGDPSFIHHLEINDLIFIISIEAVWNLRKKIPSLCQFEVEN